MDHLKATRKVTLEGGRAVTVQRPGIDDYIIVTRVIDATKEVWKPLTETTAATAGPLQYLEVASGVITREWDQVKELICLLSDLEPEDFAARGEKALTLSDALQVIGAVWELATGNAFPFRRQVSPETAAPQA